MLTAFAIWLALNALLFAWLGPMRSKQLSDRVWNDFRTAVRAFNHRRAA